MAPSGGSAEGSLPSANAPGLSQQDRRASAAGTSQVPPTPAEVATRLGAAGCVGPGQGNGLFQRGFLPSADLNCPCSHSFLVGVEFTTGMFPLVWDCGEEPNGPAPSQGPFSAIGVGASRKNSEDRARLSSTPQTSSSPFGSFFPYCDSSDAVLRLPKPVSGQHYESESLARACK